MTKLGLTARAALDRTQNTDTYSYIFRCDKPISRDFVKIRQMSTLTE